MVTGIDCSKDYFDIAVLKEGNAVSTGRFSNNTEGFAEMLELVLGTHVCMEATGPYYFQLARFLYDHGVKVSVVNPLSVRRFSQMRMSRAKTDRKDALLIAEFAQMTCPGPWRLPSEHILLIRNLETYISGLKSRRQIISNQLHALESSGTLEKGLSGQISTEIEWYGERIAQKEKEIAELIEGNYRELAKNLRSIPGIGPRSTALLITLTDGFSLFEGYRQLISYFGLAPRIYESGSSVRGKNHICKMGMGEMRKVLYMAGVSAVRCNRTCGELFERLRARGKPYKVALIAVVNKLVKQAFAIAKSGKPYTVQPRKEIPGAGRKKVVPGNFEPSEL